MSRQVWCNGRMIRAEELQVSAFDRGLTVGLGLYETLLALDGRVVFLDRHVARQGRGCERLGWVRPDTAEVAAAIEEVLMTNGLTEGRARVRLYRTAGEGTLDVLGAGGDALTVVTATAAVPPPESSSITFSKWPRNERSALVGLKCASYAENLLALADARRQGYDETYFLNTRGDVCEAATANLFVVKSGRVTTPPLASGCLPGVTREWLLGATPDLGLDVAEDRVTRNDLLDADEVFLTSATRGPVVVSRLDGRTYGAGNVSARCREAWEQAIRRKD